VIDVSAVQMLRLTVPVIVAPGCLDMVNFGVPATIPAKFAGRTLYRHNPQVTLMRTTPEECAVLGRIVAEKVNLSTAPVTVLIPLGAISVVSEPGQPFHDPAAAPSSTRCGAIFVRTFR
jgi:uncharacterized protein (UPF0261 family)